MAVNPRLLEFCVSDKQRALIEHLNRYETIAEAAKHYHVSERNMMYMLQRIRKQAADHGYRDQDSALRGSPPPIDEHFLQRENRQLRAELDGVRSVLASDSTLARLYNALAATQQEPPQWTYAPPKRGVKHPVIATAFLSDTHFDEVVVPEQINGVNAYNRKIAEQRLRAFFDKICRMRDWLSGFSIEGMVLALGGDIVSGNIHEELQETNEATMIETCLHWSGQLKAGVRQVRDVYPKVHVVAVPGNHGRNTRKPRMKNRVQDNFDYLIYKIIEMSAPPGVTFQIPLETDARWQLYRTKYQMTHGDQFRGGSGWGGVASPVMRGDQKKRQRESAINTPYDVLMMGHWHQFKDFGGVLMNGSLKGYDEYAYINNFEFELPQQAFFLTNPEHGKIMTCPIFVAEHEAYAANDFLKVAG